LSSTVAMGVPILRLSLTMD